MTPLAYALTKKMLAGNMGDYIDKVGGVEQMRLGVHCFECTEIIPLLPALSDPRIAIDDYIFLPSVRTWIEWTALDNKKLAALLFDDGKREGYARTYLFAEDYVTGLGYHPIGAGTSEREYLLMEPLEIRREDAAANMRCITAFLYLINSPKIVHREQHEPHAALKRAQRRDKSLSFFRWSEINLKISTRNSADAGSILTGQRALHHVRQFARVRLGRLELVSEHWRGDAKNGVVVSHHKVTP